MGLSLSIFEKARPCLLSISIICLRSLMAVSWEDESLWEEGGGVNLYSAKWEANISYNRFARHLRFAINQGDAKKGSYWRPLSIPRKWCCPILLWSAVHLPTWISRFWRVLRVKHQNGATAHFLGKKSGRQKKAVWHLLPLYYQYSLLLTKLGDDPHKIKEWGMFWGIQL